MNALYLLLAALCLLYTMQVINFAFDKINPSASRKTSIVSIACFNTLVIFLFYQLGTLSLSSFYLYALIFFEILVFCKAHAFSAFLITNMICFILIATILISYTSIALLFPLNDTSITIAMLIALIVSILAFEFMKYDFKEINFLKILSRKSTATISAASQFYLFFSSCVALCCLMFLKQNNNMRIFILIQTSLALYFFFFSYKSFIHQYRREEEIHSNIQEVQYKNQLEHYNNYLAYSKNLNEFSLRYKKNMGILHTYIQNKEYDSVYDLVIEINDDMQNNVDVHHHYSNNQYIDAILRDCANRFLAQNLPFESIFFYPTNTTTDKKNIIYFMDALLTNIEKFCFIQKETKSSSLKINSKNNSGFIKVHIVANNKLSLRLLNHFENVYVLGLQNEEYIFDFDPLCHIVSHLKGFTEVKISPENGQLELILNLPNNLS